MEKAMAKKKSEEEILFPDVKIGKYTVKPWSFGKLFEISSLLESVLDKIEKKGLDKLFTSTESVVSYTTIARLFTICSAELLELIAMTVGASEDNIKELSMQDGVKTALIIYRQNSEIIKNVVSTTLAERPEMVEEVKD